MTDAAEPNENSDVPTRRTGRGVMVFVVFLVIYPFSVFPVELFLEKVGLFDYFETVLGVVYAPLRFLAERFEFVEHFYNWYRGFF